MITTAARHADIARIIQGTAPTPLSLLPAVWQNFHNADYRQAAQMFMSHGTPLAYEALNAIGQDFASHAYPDLNRAAAQATTALAHKTIAALRDIKTEFGHDIPASLYHLMLACVVRDDSEALMDMFKDKSILMRDRLWDATLHAALLVTPIGLRMHSILSRHGLRLEHVMNCGCKITEVSEPAFEIALDPALKPAYLQNMVAAALEQYGVNAATSKAQRGF